MFPMNVSKMNSIENKIH